MRLIEFNDIKIFENNNLFIRELKYSDKFIGQRIEIEDRLDWSDLDSFNIDGFKSYYTKLQRKEKLLKLNK